MGMNHRYNLEKKKGKRGSKRYEREEELKRETFLGERLVWSIVV